MGILTTNEQVYYTAGGNHGNYRYISLTEIMDSFRATYVGKDKICERVLDNDITFHATRAMQELSYDTLKSVKDWEIEVPSTLVMVMPVDYINYVKLSWSDGSGVEHVIYPTSKTSNATPILQDSDGDYSLNAEATITSGSTSIVLDSEYKNISVGMKVTGAGPNTSGVYTVPNNTVVYSTSNSGGITTIELITGITVFTPSNTFTETLTFIPTDDSLVLQEESSHIVETLSWDIVNPRITASSASDISSIKPGMRVSHLYFPVGTTVVDVIDEVITTSAVATTVVASGGEVTFISDTVISDTWNSYKSTTPAESNDNYEDDTYWPYIGARYGVDPQHAQANGSFFIDESTGKFHFSSNLGGKTLK